VHDFVLNTPSSCSLTGTFGKSFTSNAPETKPRKPGVALQPLLPEV
jgi:hypothetical protein